MFLKWLVKKCYPDYPEACTAEEWCEWEKKEKQKPLCYFITNVLPSWWTYNINNKIHDIIYWFKYRLFPSYKYHLINTGLKPAYYEIETRMLHGLFNLLKEYCEVEQPYFDWCCQKHNIQYKRQKFYSGYEAALESFKWQKQLVYTEDEIFNENDKVLIGTPTPQALHAAELEFLYLWWMDIYPNRIDPYIVYPDPYFDNLICKDVPTMKHFCKRPPNEEQKFKEICKLRDALEKKYQDEDDEMLLRLINMRRFMWT